MSLNRLFDGVTQVRETAHWQAAFGKPQEVEGKTLIPVAQVGYGFGLGFGSAAVEPETKAEPPPAGEGGGEGGGGGGGAVARPLGAFVVTPEYVYFEQVQNDSRIILCSLGVAALFILQLAKTLRAIVAGR